MSPRQVPALASLLAEGEAVVTAWSGLPDTRIAAIFGRAGYRAITLDMQHGLHDFASVGLGIAAACGAGVVPIVRVPVDDFATASRACDAGAQAVIAPMIDGAEAARRFVAHVKYAPVGERSWGPAVAMALAGETDPKRWFATANDRTLTFAMIETRAALDALDDILAVPGLDGIFVGPADLSIALDPAGGPSPSGEEMRAVAASIAASAVAAGRYAGFYAVGPDDVRFAVDAGFRLIAFGNDMGLLGAAATAALESIGAGAE